MNVASMGFAAFVLLFAVIYYSNRNVDWRLFVRSAANAVFVYSFVASPLALLPLAAFLAIGYLMIEWARTSPSRWSWLTGLSVILASYIYLKRFSFIAATPALPLSYTTVGLSYVLFRLMHLFIDAGNGDVPERVRLPDYLNYCCNLFCFVSGPIQRYEDYLADRINSGAEPDAREISMAMSRMVKGFFKVVAVSAVASYAFQHVSPPLLDNPRQLDPLVAAGGFMAAVAAYCAYLYYNFSGYTDIVIGAGALLGQRLPENFDRPFSARSFLEFWSRWHMTLSNWFKFYLFNPLVAALVGRFPSKRALPYIGVAAFFVTFLVMGLWHGTTGVFVIYGLLMGAGASVNKLWQIAMIRWLGNERYRLVQQRGLYAALARGLTYSYFSIGISCLWMSAGQLASLLSAIGLSGLMMDWITLTLFSAVALQVLDRLAALVTRLVGPIAQAFPSSTWANRWSLAAQILIVIGIASLFHKAPEFVYKAF